MTTMTEADDPGLPGVHQRDAEQIWDAITKPEFTRKYFHGARIEVEPRRRADRFGPDGSSSGATATCSSPTRRAASCTRGARSTTRSSPPRSRAASPGRSSRRKAATRSSRSCTTARGRAEDGRERLRPGLDDGAQRPEDAARDRRAADDVLGERVTRRRARGSRRESSASSSLRTPRIRVRSLLGFPGRSRSSPSATRARTGIVSVPTSTTVSGWARRLWYQPGFTGEPPLEPKTAKSSPTARYTAGLT